MSNNEMRVAADLPYESEHTENLWIPLKDGQRLAARLWLPKAASARPVPAIVEYIPYRKRDLTRERDAINMPYLAGHGFACLRVDLRGSGDSDGVLRDQYLEQEQNDGVEAIAWIAGQAWCDGNIGMMGISWGGFNALQIAARRPKALKAIIAASATDDLYADNMHYMGGSLLADNLSESTTMFAFNSLPPDPAIVGARWRKMWLDRLRESGLWLDIWLRQQRRTEFWKRGSVCENYGSIQCPVMAVSGWADGYTNAVFRLMEHLNVPRKGLVGPWGHKYPHQGIPGPAIGFLQEVRRWFDQWLKHEETGIMKEPGLRVWMQDSVPPTTAYAARPGRWIAEDSWPSSKVERQSWQLARRNHMHPMELSEETSGIVSIQSPLTLGYFGGKWCSYAAAPDLPYDQRLEDGGALFFDSDPLSAPVEILGRAKVNIRFSADEPVAQLTARLSDIRPDDSVTRVTYGVLNLTHRDSHENPSYLEPGKWYTAQLRLNEIAQHFPKGHRIRLALSTSYWPLVWPAPKPVKIDIDLAQSQLELPIRKASGEEAKIRDFGEPEGAEPLEKHLLEPEEANWYVHHDLAAATTELEVIRSKGKWHIEETATDIENAFYEWYRSEGNRYASVEGETFTRRRLSREGWDAGVTTRSVLTSNESDFFLRAEIDAFEGDKRIFSENWDETIARDFI
ncbi:MAG TPA: CocE/NonD family hydrolase [Opitutales bacterium]|nr:CocE/NonD family hydrolase [Opitutales bacterium]